MQGKPIRSLISFCLLVALPFGIWGITGSGPTPFLDRLISFLFGFSNGLLFASVLLVFSFLHKKLFGGLVLAFNAASYTIMLVTLSYYLHFGFPFSSSSLLALMETNKQEVTEFITSIGWLRVTFLLLSFAGMHFLLIRYGRRLLENASSVLPKPRAIVLASLGLIYAGCILKNDLLFQDNMLFALRDVYDHYREEKELITEQSAELKKRNFQFTVSRPDSLPEQETYFLVLGESLSKHHMSLYGYKRETNPELEKIRNELLIFTNVVSPNNTTVPCLKKILTFANCGDNEALLTKPGLLQLMNKAGFTTYWISNQSYSGTHDTWASLFSLDATEKYFTNYVNSINSNPVYDEAVLDPLQKVLDKPVKKKFIVVHLIGSHQRADFRYPASYSKFTSFSDQPLTYPNAGMFEKRYVNAYDNSVLYNDHIVSEIIKKTQDLKQNSFVLYFPDHGEEVCEQSELFGHSDGILSRYMVEIPMILWRSSEFKKNSSLDNSITTRAYQMDDVIHSVLELTQTNCQHFIPEKSIFNPNFKPEKRFVEDRWDYDSLVPVLKK